MNDHPLGYYEPVPNGDATWSRAAGGRERIKQIHRQRDVQQNIATICTTLIIPDDECMRLWQSSVAAGRAICNLLVELDTFFRRRLS